MLRGKLGADLQFRDDDENLLAYCWFAKLRQVISRLSANSLKLELHIVNQLRVNLDNQKSSGAPNENIVQNHLNIALLNVF